MEDDTDVDGSPDRRPDRMDSKLDHPTFDDESLAAEPFSRAEWEQLPTDPDPVENLGYDRVDWEEFAALDGTDQVMFLPADEDVLREDAFVVADRQAVCDLAEQR